MYARTVVLSHRQVQQYLLTEYKAGYPTTGEAYSVLQQILLG